MRRAAVFVAVLVALAGAAAALAEGPRARRAVARDSVPAGLLARDARRLVRSVAVEELGPAWGRGLAVARAGDEDVEDIDHERDDDK